MSVGDSMSEYSSKKEVLIRSTVLAVITVAVIFIAAQFFYVTGMVIPNNPKQFHIRGIDVSSREGEIDWNALSKHIDFAYIKATEGANTVDPEFSVNYSQVNETDIRAGY